MKSTTRLIAHAAVSALCALSVTACEAPRERRLLAFWDPSASITSAERAPWAAALTEEVRGYGEELWEEYEFDEVVLLPAHERTSSATPLVRQRFSGGEFNDNTRRKQWTSFAAQLAGVDTLRYTRGVLAHTDLLSCVTRIEEYMDDDMNAIPEVIFFSDMMHSMPDLDFERGDAGLSTQAATDLARQIVGQRQWRADLLEGINVRVRLPGTVSGASGENDRQRLEAVETFWRTLFGELGASSVQWQRM